MKPPLPVSDAARAMSDAMLCSLLPSIHNQPSTIHQARTAFISYCRAHPQFKDIRTAWASFHKELMAHLESAPSVLSVAFPHTETPHAIPIGRSPSRHSEATADAILKTPAPSH